MQNHSNKTIIIIINDRKPRVASTATGKRRNHRKRPSEQLQKHNFFIKTRDRKEPPDPSPTSWSSSLLQPTSKHLLRYLLRNNPQGDLLGQLLQDTEADGTILMCPGFCRNKNFAAFGEAAFEEQSSDRIPLLGGDSEQFLGSGC